MIEAAREGEGTGADGRPGARGTIAAGLGRLERLRLRLVDRYGTWSHLAQFLAVGASGLVVNLGLLTAFLWLGVPHALAIGLAIALSLLWNFALNRRFSFSYARGAPVLPQLAGFATACSAGAAVNYAVTTALWSVFEHKQVAAALGVAAGTALNFLGSRFVVFRRRAGERRR